jgi:hypothetical protein
MAKYRIPMDSGKYGPFYNPFDGLMYSRGDVVTLPPVGQRVTTADDGVSSRKPNPTWIPLDDEAREAMAALKDGPAADQLEPQNHVRIASLAHRRR